jgi:hypothetical protein
MQRGRSPDAIRRHLPAQQVLERIADALAGTVQRPGGAGSVLFTRGEQALTGDSR